MFSAADGAAAATASSKDANSFIGDILALSVPLELPCSGHNVAEANIARLPAEHAPQLIGIRHQNRSVAGAAWRARWASPRGRSRRD